MKNNEKYSGRRILYGYSLVVLLLCHFFTSCTSNNSSAEKVPNDTIYVHDTVSIGGSFIYNLPCKVEYIHPEKSGKAILLFWLHGGVHDQPAHNLLNAANNHIDQWRNTAHNAFSEYLKSNDIKAVYVTPICHKAEVNHCVRWIDCWNDIEKIMDDYVDCGIVDESRIYIAGCSDGGAGVWDFIEYHGNRLAAAMSFSCGSPRMTTVPVYYSSTSAEGDKTSIVNDMKAKGANIQYTFVPGKHGEDEKLTLFGSYLKAFFDNVKPAK